MYGNARLDPVRLRSPRMRALLRYTMVASLLALAAVTLLVDPAPPADCLDPPGAAGRSASRQSDPRPTASPATTPDAGDPMPLPPGTVGVPVQLAEPGTASAVRRGNRVDVVARAGSPGHPPPSTGEADPVLARDALVVSVTSPNDGVVFLAMTPRQARRVSGMAPEVAIGLTVRPR